MFTAVIAGAAETEPKSIPFYSASAFLQSTGVCAHLDSEPYRSRPALVIEALRALGVSHLRCDVLPDTDVSRWSSICRQAGVRAHLLASPAETSVAAVLRMIDELGLDAVSAVEGQNEGDSDWFKAQPAARPSWAEAVTRYQAELYRALSRRYGSRRPTVASPTVLDYAPQDMASLVGAAPFCDAVALHAYPQAAKAPESTEAYASLRWYWQRFAAPFKPGAPVMITETGYSQFRNGPSARALERYLPRLLLHAFAAGSTRTILYELLDSGSDASDTEQNYGLVTLGGDRKPSFQAVAALLSALAGPAAAAPGAPPPIRVTAPSDVRCLGFAKRDGAVVLACWRAVPSWDPITRRDRVVSPREVQLGFPRAVAQLETRRLTAGSDWEPHPAVDRPLRLACDDAVTLVRWTGRSAR